MSPTLCPRPRSSWSWALAGRGRPLDPAWPAGAGSVVINGLSPGDDLRRGGRRAWAPPLPRRPPADAGRARRSGLLCRFATVSDVHIGERRFGVMGRIHDALEGPAPDGGQPGEPYPVRALRAAIDEAVAWGAELHRGQGRPHDPDDAGRGARRGPDPGAPARCPWKPFLGNHDNKQGVNSRAILEQQGLAVPWVPWARDLPGVRLVLVNTVQGDPRYHRGQLPPEMGRMSGASWRRSRPARPGWRCTTRPSSTGSRPSTLPVCPGAKAATSWTHWRPPSPTPS